MRRKTSFPEDEVVRREDRHNRARIPPGNPEEREENTGSGVAVGGLNDERAGPESAEVSVEIPFVLPVDNRKDSLLTDDVPDAVEGMGEHRAGAGKCAELLRAGLAEEAEGELLEPPPVPPCEHDGPEETIARVHVYSRVRGEARAAAACF